MPSPPSMSKNSTVAASRSTSPTLAPVVEVAEAAMVEAAVEEEDMAVEEATTVVAADMVATKVAMEDTVLASKHLLMKQKLITLQAVLAAAAMVRKMISIPLNSVCVKAEFSIQAVVDMVQEEADMVRLGNPTS